LNYGVPTILVFGNEGKGLPDSILDVCDHVISIPSAQLVESTVDSLNLSVSVGIILHSLAQCLNKE